MRKLAIVLTVRSGSERLPNKCMIEIKGKPLLHWIVKRLQKVKGSQVILATTRNKEDGVIAELGQDLKINVFRGEERDVVGRVDKAVNAYAPDADLVMRGLADMPFIATELVDRAAFLLSKYSSSQAMLWHLPADIWPVYGAREFPFSRAGWNTIARRSSGRDEREHVDMYFHHNRRMFQTLYHEPPPPVYFRDYRLEVDYEEDIELVKVIAAKYGMLKPLPEIIKFLDKNPDVAAVNRERVEKTGPTTTYTYSQRRLWMRELIGKPLLDWENKWWNPMNDRAEPIFCRRGHHLGFAQDGILHTISGEIQLEAGSIKCMVEDCGAKTVWQLAKPGGRNQ